MTFNKDRIFKLRCFLNEVQEALPDTEHGAALYVGLDCLFEELAEGHADDLERCRKAMRKRQVKVEEQ